MRRSSTHFSAFLLAALAPVLLQSTDCGTPGNATLSSLEVEAAGVDRVVGFRSQLTSYAIGTTSGVDTITIRAQPVSPSARVNYRLFSDPIESGLVGAGGGEVEVTIPVNQPVTLMLEVTDGSTRRTYSVDINVLCHTSPCDDENSCSVDTCDPLTAICEFDGVADAEPCTGDRIVDGSCSAGRCESTARVISFESLTVDDQNARFGLDIDRYYDGLDWAYDDPARIAGPTCTVATLSPPACWGSWAVDDVAATGVSGASGSENWLRARASGVGKGAKITGVDSFVFRSMMLFTRDRTSYPAFVEEITVTTRDINDVDVSTVVSLQAETWIEVTAGDLGLGDTDVLKAMWFNAAGIDSPNGGKFGLDDFKVALD